MRFICYLHSPTFESIIHRVNIYYIYGENRAFWEQNVIIYALTSYLLLREIAFWYVDSQERDKSNTG